MWWGMGSDGLGLEVGVAPHVRGNPGGLERLHWIPASAGMTEIEVRYAVAFM